jgi:TolA-binding protein
MNRKRLIFLALSLFLCCPCFAEATDSTASTGGSSPLDFANGLYARKMYGPAISEYEKFILENPDSPEVASARFRSADSHYFAKNYKSAIAYFEEFIKKYPADKRVPMAKFRIATAHYYLNDFAAAMRSLTELAKSAEDANIRAGSLLYQGRIYDSHNKTEDSLPRYLEILEKYPDTEYAVYASMAASAFGALHATYGRQDNVVLQNSLQESHDYNYKM